MALACVKRLVVVAQRYGGQSQISSLLATRGKSTSPLARVQDYVQTHLRELFPIKRLAEIGGASTRTIGRLFVTELGITCSGAVGG